MIAAPALEVVLRDALEAMAPPEVRVGVLAITDAFDHELFDGERRHVTAARPRRQHEFATGRVLLRQLIGEPVEIPVLSTRAPRLPLGVVASLAHDARVAVAAVGPRSRYAALGIDVEPVGPMTPGEAAIVRAPGEADLDPRLAFVLKEAAYKAWSGCGGPMLDFPDVLVQVAGGAFSAEVVRFGVTYRGAWCEAEGRYLALVAG